MLNRPGVGGAVLYCSVLFCFVLFLIRVGELLDWDKEATKKCVQSKANFKVVD